MGMGEMGEQAASTHPLLRGERLQRDITLDMGAGTLPLGVDVRHSGPRVVQSVNVTYMRWGSPDEPVETVEWHTDVVRLAGEDGVNIQIEVDTVRRGHRTEGVFSTLRVVSSRMVRESRGDLPLRAMPEWLDDLVEQFRPGASG